MNIKRSFRYLPVLTLLFSCGQTATSTPLSSLPSTPDAPSSLSSESSSEEYTKEYVPTRIKEPTIIEPGIVEFRCTSSSDSYQEKVYDLDEFVFESASFAYDGKPHSLTIKGMIPLSTRVEYENNTLTEIGSVTAKAKILDEDGNLLDQREATLSIVENIGYPVVSIDTNNTPITDKENYVAMSLTTSNCDAKQVLTEVAGGIRWRGNGTLTYDKKAYRLKFDSKVNMFGLNDGNKFKSWVLLADYCDQSMMRNQFAHKIGDSLFNYSGNYATESRHVSVFLNNEYQGVYLVAEQQQANKNRINIAEAESDYEGTDVGYLLELDNYANEEDFHFSVGSQWGDQVKGANLSRKEYSIKTDCYGDAQVPYIKKYLGNVYTAFMRAVKGEGLYVLDENHDLVASPYQGMQETLESMIDIESLAKAYLLHELIKSVDVGFSSFYLWVDFSANSLYPKLTFGAPWDFDWSSGNTNDANVAKTNGAYNSTSFQKMNPWLFLFSKTDFFSSLMPKYYKVFCDSGIFESTLAYIEHDADAYANEFAANFDKWQILGTIVPKFTPNDALNFTIHHDAVDHFTNWLTNRKSYLDTAFAIKKA